MKILILGVSGSGKSTLAKKYATDYRIESIDLDTFFAGVRLPQEEADTIINRLISEKKDWVIEGAYLFPQLCEAADRIILMKTPAWLCIWRIWKRFFTDKKKRAQFGFRNHIRLSKNILKQYSNQPAKNYKSFRMYAAEAMISQYEEKVQRM